jgi:hypothetical protein
VASALEIVLAQHVQKHPLREDVPRPWSLDDSPLDNSPVGQCARGELNAERIARLANTERSQHFSTDVTHGGCVSHEFVCGPASPALLELCAPTAPAWLATLDDTAVTV